VKNTVLLIIMLFICSNAMAIFIPSYERSVLFDKDMEIIEASGIFEKLDQVGMIMNRREDSAAPTSIILTIRWANGVRDMRKLTIVRTEERIGNTVKYLAQSMDRNQERYFVELTETINDAEDFSIWEVSLRHGFDFDASMNSTMDLLGHPEPTHSLM